MKLDPKDWQGVLPAITTPFRADLSIDFDFLKQHVGWLIENGCRGAVALGSLGESATLAFDEKVEILKACRQAAGGGLVVAGIAGLATSECVALAKQAESAGCDGLMALPPYVYRGDWRETEAHYSAVLGATSLSCMLYNNPIAYGTDVIPEQMGILASRHSNLHSVKESSGDVRRVTAIHETLGDRLAVFIGVDDLIVEGVAAGAVGWIAGLVNALPRESVRLFELARAGKRDEARKLYEWFLPLLRLDVVPKFVQLIKLVQEEVGMGNSRVRPPRLQLEGGELAAATALIRERLKSRPKV
jgi:dihydrodipicolinate synthase/N-acetylneuraminate lyase